MNSQLRPRAWISERTDFIDAGALPSSNTMVAPYGRRDVMLSSREPVVDECRCIAQRA